MMAAALTMCCRVRPGGSGQHTQLLMKMRQEDQNIQGHSELQSEFKVRLGHLMSSFLKIKQEGRWGYGVLTASVFG